MKRGNRINEDVCSGHYIREQELNATTLDDIRRITHFACQNELRFAEHICKKQGKEAQQEVHIYCCDIGLVKELPQGMDEAAAVDIPIRPHKQKGEAVPKRSLPLQKQILSYMGGSQNVPMHPTPRVHAFFLYVALTGNIKNTAGGDSERGDHGKGHET